MRNLWNMRKFQWMNTVNRQNTSCDFENQTQYKKDDESGPTVVVKKTYKLSAFVIHGSKK